MSNARNLANLLNTSGEIESNKLDDNAVHGRRNLIINGAMTVAQRGTSSAAHTSGYPCVDRFKSGGTLGTAAVTMSQSTDAPDGFVNSLKMDVTTADTSLPSGDYYIPCTQAIEAQDLQHLNYGTSEAKSFVVSFWVKSNKTGTYTVEVYNQDTTLYINTKQYTINTADTWEYKTLTYEANTNTAANILNDNGAGFYINWWVAAGSTYNDGTGTVQTGWNTLINNKRATGVPNMLDSTDNEWLITGIQVEVGEKATPFEHRSYGEELQLCQRYYQQYINPNLRGVSNITTSAARMGMQLPVVMRAAPSVAINNITTNHFRVFDGSVTPIYGGTSASYLTKDKIEFDISVTGSALTVGRAVCLYTQTTDQSKFEIDAEL